MKKNIISCMAIMVAALASACGDYQVNHECDIGDVKSENDSVIYRCVGIKDKYSYWEKEICQYGILEDKDGKKMCKECDPDNKESNKCEEINGRAQYRVCRDGVLDVIYCSNNKCSTDYVECKCSKTCLNGCEENGACRLVGTCENHDSMTGGCICQNGNNIDGSCACPQKCKYGCDENGSCKLVEGCDLHDQTGACICINGISDTGECVNICVQEDMFKTADGSCACSDKCVNGCNADGSCFCPEMCVNGCNMDGSCACSEECMNGCGEDGTCVCPSKCMAGCSDKGFCLDDINDNHMYDYYEEGSGHDECKIDSNCVDGFVCRKSDGRCVSEYFTTVWDKRIRNGKESFLFHVKNCKNGIEVCWDWKDGEECDWKKIESCSEKLSHKYENNGDGDVIIKIKGELDGVNFYRDCVVGANDGCKIDDSICCGLLEVRSFGLTGFSTWYDGNKNWKGEKNNVDRGVFEQCYKLEKISEIDIPDPQKLTTMSRMFLDACSFNSPIEQWDVSNVTNMEKTFWMSNCVPDAIIGQGQHCFEMYPLFNQSLNRWNVSNVTNMSDMFNSLPSFNQPLNDWDVSKVMNMVGMFAHAVAFNYPLNKWKVERVTNMGSMFYRALSFDQDLSKWKPVVIKEANGLADMFGESGISKNNYCGFYNMVKKINGVNLGNGLYANASMCK